MATPRTRRAARHRARRQRAQHRARRLAVIGIVAALALVTLILTAFGSSSPEPVATTTASTPVASGVPPEPEPLATVGNLQIKLPVAGEAVTAIGFHGEEGGAMELSPVGRQANEGLLARLWRRIAGSSQEGPVWYQLEGGPGTEVLDVGAAPGTDVYSPVDGTVVSISDFVVDGKAYGSRIDVRPSAAPALIVTLSHLEPDPSLAVGSPVLASSSKLGIGRRRGGCRAAGAREARARSRQQRRDRRAPGCRIAPVTLNILFIGDVVGRPGREALEDRLASLRAELDASVCIVNGENVADGVGITPKLADRLLAAGADAITLGNHTWRRQEIGPYLGASDRVIRPANLPDPAPARASPSSRPSTAPGSA